MRLWRPTKCGSWRSALIGTIIMTGDGAVNEQLWSLVHELSSQLTENKQQVEALRKQVHALNGQAVHAKSGYALRRFNVDLSQEVFTSQLEQLNAQLVNENTMLAHEAKQLGSLLRESESTLETIMSKFRAFSHAAQQHGLDLTAYYESRLAMQTHRIDDMVMRDQDTMHTLSDRVGGLVRDALRSIDGEHVDQSSDEMESITELERLRHDNEILRSLLGLRHTYDTSNDDEQDRLSPADVSVSCSSHTPELPPMEPTAQAGDSDAPLDEVDAGVPAAST